MIIEVKGWQEEAQLRALKFAEDTTNGFSLGLDSCVPRLPKVEHDGKKVYRAIDRDILLEIFLDVLVGVTADIAASYCNDLSSQFEDKIVHEFRRKFFVMRQRTMGAEAELKKLAIQQPGEKSDERTTSDEQRSETGNENGSLKT